MQTSINTAQQFLGHSQQEFNKLQQMYKAIDTNVSKIQAQMVHGTIVAETNPQPVQSQGRLTLKSIPSENVNGSGGGGNLQGRGRDNDTIDLESESHVSNLRPVNESLINQQINESINHDIEEVFGSHYQSENDPILNPSTSTHGSTPAMCVRHTQPRPQPQQPVQILPKASTTQKSPIRDPLEVESSLLLLDGEREPSHKGRDRCESKEDEDEDEIEIEAETDDESDPPPLKEVIHVSSDQTEVQAQSHPIHLCTNTNQTTQETCAPEEIKNHDTHYHR